MFDFRDVAAAKKSEQIRAWAVEQAIDGFNCEGSPPPTDEALVRRAAKIEEYVLNGKDD